MVKNNESAQLSAQEKIYQVVNQIPYSKVATYGQVADLAGLPGRARLVGKSLANLSNDLANNVAWHRVINAQGKISLPLGSECFERQKSLLLAEGVIVLGNNIKLSEYQWHPDLAELLFKLSF